MSFVHKEDTKKTDLRNGTYFAFLNVLSGNSPGVLTKRKFHQIGFLRNLLQERTKTKVSSNDYTCLDFGYFSESLYKLVLEITLELYICNTLECSSCKAL